MVAALKSLECDEPLWRIKVNAQEVPLREPSDFVTTNTKKLFAALDIPADFLQLLSSAWQTNDNFLLSRRRVMGFKVVNDAVERGDALIQSVIQWSACKSGRTEAIATAGG